MDKYGEITLIGKTYEKDEIGQFVPASEAEKTIECKIDSVGRSEWLTAHQGGYEAQFVMDVFSASYNGEKKVRYKGKTYDIYRTYQRGDRTELYIGDKVGDLDADPV